MKNNLIYAEIVQVSRYDMYCQFILPAINQGWEKISYALEQAWKNTHYQLTEPVP